MGRLKLEKQGKASEVYIFLQERARCQVVSVFMRVLVCVIGRVRAGDQEHEA